VFDTRVTLVLHREDGTWRIVHSHASVGGQGSARKSTRSRPDGAPTHSASWPAANARISPPASSSDLPLVWSGSKPTTRWSLWTQTTPRSSTARFRPPASNPSPHVPARTGRDSQRL
jgi:hypothetical protein